jgi:hypothetical protein
MSRIVLTMTTLLIQTDNIPLTVNFLAIVKMTQVQFDEFYQPNQDLRIERTVQAKATELIK